MTALEIFTKFLDALELKFNTNPQCIIFNKEFYNIIKQSMLAESGLKGDNFIIKIRDTEIG